MRSVTDEFGYNHHIFTAARPADLSIFSELERQTIDAVVVKIASMSAREVSDLSHEDAGWQMVDLGESIPYASAYIGADTELPERLRAEVESSARQMTSKLGSRLAG